MRKDKKTEETHDYKIVISELGISPFRMIRVAFALMGVIPLLIIFYIVIGKHFLYNIFLGSDGFIIVFSILITVIGFLYAYSLVGEMAKKLLIYSSERKRSDDEKTELLMAVTHDLKTPLTVIKTGIHNLLEGIGGALSKAHTGIAELCLNAINKITGFIDELLDVTKINFLRTNLKRERFDFGKMIEDEVHGIYELAKKNKQGLNYKIQTKDSNIWADRKKLSRAVMNLLSNAIKYTPQGGRIDVALSADENSVKLAVINTGSGIPADELDRILNKFERLEKHAKVEGAGLGLSITKDIVDLHKGHLTVRSEPDKETEFSMILPRDLRTR